jgi:hypothetical protein
MKCLRIAAIVVFIMSGLAGSRNGFGNDGSWKIVITSPNDGRVIQPHHLLKVKVNAKKEDFPGGITVASLDILTPAKTEPPYEFILLMPSAVGPRELTAFGIIASGHGDSSNAVTINVQAEQAPASNEDLGTLDDQSTEELQQLAFDHNQEQSVRVGAILHLKARSVPGLQDDLQKCLTPDQPPLVRMAARQALGLPGR